MLVPDGGTVTILEAAITVPSPTGFTLFGQQVDISVDPDGTIAEPLVLTFSVFAPLVLPDAVAVFRGDPAVEVADCTDPAGTSATPDPCVESRTPQGADNTVIVVRTSTASPWNFGALTSDARCVCVAVNVNPNQEVLRNVAAGGKGSTGVRKMTVILEGQDAPGQNCRGNAVSDPTKINLKMVDDDGDVLIDSGKTIVCTANNVGVHAFSLEREVFFRGPLNCENSAVPTGGFSNGDITATVSVAGQPDDFVEVFNLKCFE